MLGFIRFIVVCIALAGSTANGAENSRRIVVVGDSISAGYGLELNDGWVTLLQQRLEDLGYEYKVVNASISGDTTAGGRSRLPRALARYEPALVVIELGGNDGLRGIQLSVMRENLRAMIEASKNVNAQVVLLGMRIPENYGNRYAEAFFSTYAGLADEYDLAYVQFFLDGVALNDNLMQDDGIHPNKDAQPQLLENAWPAIEPLIEKPLQAASRLTDH